MDRLSDETFRSFFSAFSAHPITFRDVTYKTVEHAYHAQRYTDAKIVQDILDSATPEEAWRISQQHKAEQIADFNDQKLVIMEALFRTKLKQHPDVRNALLASGDVLIVKHEPKDSWWGDGPDGSGRNEMGKLWMRLRDESRNDNHNQP